MAKPHTFLRFVVAFFLLGSCLVTKTLSLNVAFRLSAKFLQTKDIFSGDPDTYIDVTYTHPPNDPVKLGKTSVINNSKEPQWPELFNVGYVEGTTQNITLDLYDDDIGFNDYMGSATVTLEKIVHCPSGILQINATRLSKITGTIQITTYLSHHGHVIAKS